MVLEEVYQKIALNMHSNIVGDWISAYIDFEREADDSFGIKGGYILTNKQFNSFKLRGFDREIFDDFETIYAITTKNADSNWNRARFTLFPDGEFSIDFKWAQDLADEIERLSNED
ncbi:hypothetical protein PN836_003545 [Ningiella sp. W23]|uniref:hypothetical protein n=1 Tax=Ningiella sp. W23 TaxID=3023715 RepID=UPI00375650BA